MRIAWDRRELLLKVVYYGPPRAGKTTNLEQLQQMIAPEHRSDLISLNTYGDRTLFFDLLQVSLSQVGGLTPRVSVYTVPGQPRYRRVREIVLRGADGVIYVADSAPERLGENVRLWHQMHQQLRRMHQEVPILIQVNKRDLPNALPTSSITRALDPHGRYPVVEAQAKHGIGVKESFMQILMMILTGETV
ncbi:MAG: gliding-motility protein MglA [Chloroflexi bacterium]|nr:gliding-motility protein MglA [Chloroflexota bacterium]